MRTVFRLDPKNKKPVTVLWFGRRKTASATQIFLHTATTLVPLALLIILGSVLAVIDAWVCSLGALKLLFVCDIGVCCFVMLSAVMLEASVVVRMTLKGATDGPRGKQQLTLGEIAERELEFAIVACCLALANLAPF